MSKLYEKYKVLKSEDTSKFYLFKSGIFYIFLDEDAIKMSEILNLKLTNLNQSIVKCGFPVKNLDKYLQLLTYIIIKLILLTLFSLLLVLVKTIYKMILLNNL